MADGRVLSNAGRAQKQTGFDITHVVGTKDCGVSSRKRRALCLARARDDVRSFRPSGRGPRCRNFCRGAFLPRAEIAMPSPRSGGEHLGQRRPAGSGTCSSISTARGIRTPKCIQSPAAEKMKPIGAAPRWAKRIARSCGICAGVLESPRRRIDD